MVSSFPTVLNKLVQDGVEHRAVLTSDTGLLSRDGICVSEPDLNELVEGLTSDAGLLSHDETIETDRPFKVDNNVVSRDMSRDNTSQCDMLFSSSGVNIDSEPGLNEVGQIDAEHREVISEGLTLDRVSDQLEVPLVFFEAANVPVTKSVSPETDMDEALQETNVSSQLVPSRSGLSEKVRIGVVIAEGFVQIHLQLRISLRMEVAGRILVYIV
ncbi:hypothetical protein V6N13_121424 [Hibiscus sabdariffa]